MKKTGYFFCQFGTFELIMSIQLRLYSYFLKLQFRKNGWNGLLRSMELFRSKYIKVNYPKDSIKLNFINYYLKFPHSIPFFHFL